MQMLLALMPLHRWDRALQIAADLGGPFGQFFRAWILESSGKEAEARAAIGKLPPDLDIGGAVSAFRAFLYAETGEDAKAEEKIQVALRSACRGDYGHFHHSAFGIAEAYALLRKPDRAIEWLEQAAETGYPCYQAFATNRNLDSLRQDPRFIALLGRLKQQWEHYKALPS